MKVSPRLDDFSHVNAFLPTEEEGTSCPIVESVKDVDFTVLRYPKASDQELVKDQAEFYKRLYDIFPNARDTIGKNLGKLKIY